MNNFNFTLKTKETIDEEKRWKKLIDAIFAGQVIPVIGPDFLIQNQNEDSSEPTNLHHLLIEVLASCLNVPTKPKTFSQLIHSKAYNDSGQKKDDIYVHINDIIPQIEASGMLHYNQLLIRLLETKLFPFVITTSFTPVVENIMKGIWGEENVKVLQFRNDTSRDLSVNKGEINHEGDLSRPTVYYMFGKHSFEPHRYVVTDIDMMEFCKAWLTGGGRVPQIFADTLKKKYLLVLGNNYSDWLFRFIWYSMRTNDTMSSSLIINDNIDNSLATFLEQLETFITNNPENVINKMLRLIEERKEQLQSAEAGDTFEYDVFISYSRSDNDVVNNLVKALKNEGLKVWFDRESIEEGDNWRSIIKKGIQSSRFFIPLLSHNIVKEYMLPHEYREEWDIAASLAKKVGGRKFIWPLAENGFNFYSEDAKIPEQLTEKHATNYDVTDDFIAFAKKMRDQVEQFKLKEQQVASYGK